MPLLPKLISLCLIGLLMFVCASDIQADDTDQESVPTPTSVLDLLPEDANRFASEWWALIEDVDIEGNPYKGYLYWSCVHTDKAITFESRTRGSDKRHFHDKLTYSLQGKLQSYQSVTWSDTGVKTLTCRVDGDAWIVTIFRSAPDHEQAAYSKQSRIAMKEEQVGTPWHFAPLVAAYHLRHGSLSYQMDWGQPKSVGYRVRAEVSVEDVGTQEVEYRGEQVDARVLLVHAGKPGTDIKNKDNPTSRAMTIMLLPNGEFLSMAGRTYGQENKLRATRTTQAEITKTFDLDLDAAPRLPQVE